MIQLEPKNVFQSGGLSENDFENSQKNLTPFLEKIETRNQGFYKIFSETEFQEEVENIKKYSQSVEGKYSDIVVCGIGGSALGTITIRDSLTPMYKNDKKQPKLHILENIDPDMISEMADFLDLEKTLFIVISKSGGTPETIAQYFYFKNLIDQKKLIAHEHFVFITGPTGFLSTQAKAHDFPTFSVPENIGGRFSVLTAVGLLPSCLIGIDIDALLLGGKSMAENFLNKNFDQNLSFQLAAVQFLSQKPNHILMPYATKLRTFSAWFAQLLAESTGKNQKGFCPIPALGVTDQHSQLQLFSDGPLDKLMLFISVENFDQNPKIPVLVGDEKTNFLKDISFKKLLHSEQKAISQALTEKKVPNAEIIIDEISAKTLGELFLLFEGATAFLGEFLGINAFDQPGVERSKVLTREILSP